jgi:geranylgeranyl diphosphate synthase type I
MIADCLAYLESKRASIVGALAAIAPASEEARDPIERVREFCGRGKMIRGSLVFLGAAACGGASAGVDLAGAAAAMELFQAGLLAHDDIMDRDETRRGAPTIHARYAAELRGSMAAGDSERVGPDDYAHVGEALGICLGDFCYFEAYAALSRAMAPSPRLGEALSLCSKVLGEVAVAQMADVRWGAGAVEPTEAQILAMYRGKTAHYSFSLPLAIGALCGEGAGLVGPFYEFGERLGILFQIRDDELGLFGPTAAIGKEQGSDLREGKKTLFRARLLAAAPDSERERLAALFGGGVEARPEDFAYIRAASERLGVARSIGEMARSAEAEALGILRSLAALGSEIRPVLEGLVDYVTRRDR